MMRMDAILSRRIISASRVALHYALIALLAFFVAYHLTRVLHVTTPFAPIGALWALIVGVSVAQNTPKETVAKARTQILGGLLGAIAALIYLFLLPEGPVGMVVLIGCVAFVCQVMEKPDYTVSAALTAAVILFFSHINPELTPLWNATLRFAEVCIGSVVAVLVVRLVFLVEHGPS